MEKTIEHHSKIFLLFVDLRKAYGSVPRQALWCALWKYGVPDHLIGLMCSFHDGMVATVVVGAEEAPPFRCGMDSIRVAQLLQLCSSCILNSSFSAG